MNKKTAYIIGGIIVVVVVIAAIYSSVHHSGQKQMQPSENMSPTPTPMASPTPTGTQGSSKVLNYGDAIKAYPNRFQFSQCQATPATIAIRVGGIVMLDNRDKTTHTIKADNKSFVIPGLHYALLYTSTVGNLSVSCDGANRATLNVEK